MTTRLPGDEARAMVRVDLPPEAAFRLFTDEIDQWWRGGLKYRVGGAARSVVRLEPGVGGRLMETIATEAGTRVVVTGEVTAWEPPHRLVFDWRAVNFAPAERTEVEVRFEPVPQGTLVTVMHRGWAAIRTDHPVRHGEAVAAHLRSMGGWWGGLLASLRECAAKG